MEHDTSEPTDVPPGPSLDRDNLDSLRKVEQKLDNCLEQEPNPSTSAHHHDDFADTMCRVCRSDEGSLYYPCLCTGSIKYVHQECLTEWLKYSKKEVCELCNHKFSFQPIYRSDMPNALPIKDILKGVAVGFLRMLRIWIVYTMVMVSWLGIVPITAARIYHTVFYLSIDELGLLPMYLFRTDNIIPDIAKGCILLTVFLCTFISLVWLRDQIVHGGPGDFLNIPGIDIEEAAVDVDQDVVGQGVEDAANVQNGGDQFDFEPEDHRHEDQHARIEEDEDEGLGADEIEDDELDGNEEPAAGGPELQEEEPELVAAEMERFRRRRNHQELHDGPERPRAPAPQVDAEDHREPEPEPAAEEGWRDWDRLNDELTWQRLLGLDGSLVFLEHVFWVISLNTVFTFVFAYTPYRIGFFMLSKMKIMQQLVYFPSIAAILIGYMTLAVLIFLLHEFSRLMKCQSFYRMSGICYLTLKVFLLVLIEIGVFPVLCGCWIDVCSLSLFSASLSSRLDSFRMAPASSVFIHWMIGMIFVFYSASFVLLLREVLRPGVLWFLRNLNDPDFNPIQEMIEFSVMRHVRRFVSSSVLFYSTIFLIVFLPLRLVAWLTPNVLPYNMSLTADTPLNELSIELLLLQVILPAILEHTQARTKLKTIVLIWCRLVGGVLKLDRYLLPDAPVAAQDGAGVAEPPAGDAPQGGGLAAEHQALLLVREPREVQPYERPSWFYFRMVLLLAAMGLSCTFSSFMAYTLPVSIGRLALYMAFMHRQAHDLYTAAIGLYICWMCFRLMQICTETLRRGFNEFRVSFLHTFSTTIKLVAISIPTLCVIPLLLGTIFQLNIITPMRVGHDQTALVFRLQDWAMGVLHLKVTCAAVMMGPDWWLKRQFELIYEDGVRDFNLTRVICKVVVPIMLWLSMLIAAPYLLGKIYCGVFVMSMPSSILVMRYVYPIFLTLISVTAFAHWQIAKFYGLAESIRNEKYLVGTQLVNYERDSVTSMNQGTQTTTIT